MSGCTQTTDWRLVVLGQHARHSAGSPIAATSKVQDDERRGTGGDIAYFARVITGFVDIPRPTRSDGGGRSHDLTHHPTL